MQGDKAEELMLEFKFSLCLSGPSAGLNCFHPWLKQGPKTPLRLRPRPIGNTPAAREQKKLLPT
jgi:hypothetical protein